MRDGEYLVAGKFLFLWELHWGVEISIIVSILPRRRSQRGRVGTQAEERFV